MKYYQFWKMNLVCFSLQFYFFFQNSCSKSYELTKNFAQEPFQPLQIVSVYIHMRKKIQQEILGFKLISNGRIQILFCELNGMSVINFIFY